MYVLSYSVPARGGGYSTHLEMVLHSTTDQEAIVEARRKLKELRQRHFDRLFVSARVREIREVHDLK